MVDIENVKIEYVDNTWINFYTSFGMLSVKIIKSDFLTFKGFLAKGLAQPNDSSSQIKISDVEIFLEGPDEDHYNLIIDSGEIRICLGLKKIDLINFAVFI